MENTRDLAMGPFSIACTFLSTAMARLCVKTGKKTSFGNTRSHSMRSTRRPFRANIQKKRVFNPETGKYVRMKVSTSYLRTLSKRMQAGKKA
jgi:large subunit ribosomal protein L28